MNWILWSCFSWFRGLFDEIENRLTIHKQETFISRWYIIGYWYTRIEIEAGIGFFFVGPSYQTSIYLSLCISIQFNLHSSTCGFKLSKTQNSKWKQSTICEVFSKLYYTRVENVWWSHQETLFCLNLCSSWTPLKMFSKHNSDLQNVFVSVH